MNLSCMCLADRMWLLLLGWETCDCVSFGRSCRTTAPSTRPRSGTNAFSRRSPTPLCRATFLHQQANTLRTSSLLPTCRRAKTVRRAIRPMTLAGMLTPYVVGLNLNVIVPVNATKDSKLPVAVVCSRFIRHFCDNEINASPSGYLEV